ncbi:hypothetical protein CAI21_13895 [Alkalilimnicola ehrlichii]|uniref:ATP-grasp domain-containing protein n=1 Tax=Alkalilimnicola ehrlichii TaxID=351052 RepID=A0A3E0WNV6_9GAMM|nr:ATP-grasp fold amidoligase family protein [Alkalilimnicola ehrlichii]RFA28003.1 hypothetical protein CAI21_13895 [Alkalilimnicola ehrlichii]RFA34654.1 hypothetical protein CAL65_14935 [Alkalilimnicola ehrlichii]
MQELPPLSEFLASAQVPDYAVTRHMARKESQPTAPSFARKLDEAVRKAEYQERVLQRTPFARLARRRHWVRRFLAEQGWLTAQVYAEGFALPELRRAIGDLHRFVVKPIHATNAWGVMPLVRSGEFSFRNLFDDREYRLVDLLAALDAPMQRYMFPNLWQLEELLLPPDGEPSPLPDYKVYAFQGEAPLILQVRREAGEPRYRWYDSTWQAVKTGKHEDRLDPETVPPVNAEAILESAREISRILPTAFCRIDLYDTQHGVVVGELTPEPGLYHKFDPLVDLYLGVLYEQAELRRLTELEEVATLQRTNSEDRRVMHCS